MTATQTVMTHIARQQVMTCKKPMVSFASADSRNLKTHNLLLVGNKREW